ncbi:MAG TPA: CBS domain-containing protein [Thermoanaerobaculia bacterium]|nr:CBS domain-containing protein [Thermoanaerobaculia bacterium]
MSHGEIVELEEMPDETGPLSKRHETTVMGLRVRDLMTRGVVSVAPEDSVAKAYDLMLEHRFRHLTVIAGDGELVGLLTHRDLLRHSLIERAELPLSLQRSVLQRIRVEEVMTSEVQTAAPGQSLRQAALIMLANKFGCLPVVEEAEVVGILTEADFVRYFALAAQTPAPVATSGPS